MIRAALPADLPAIAAVEAAVFAPVVYPDFFFRQAMDLWPGMLLLAECEGAITGYILCAPAAAPGEAWIVSVAVHPEQRGRGFGAALVSAALDALRGYSVVRLTVHPSSAAVGLYERQGFRGLDVIDDYFGPGEPRLPMMRSR